MADYCPCCGDPTHLGRIRSDPVKVCSECGYYADDSGEYTCTDCSINMSEEPARWHARMLGHKSVGRSHDIEIKPDDE